MFKGKKLAVIGTGVMGEAMIRGLIAQGSVEPHQITGTNALLDRNEEMQIKHHIHVTDDNAAAVESADIVIISVKPQVLPRIAPVINGKIRYDALVLSIIAGVPISALTSSLDHTEVARAMPNTPAQIGEGMTVWTATPTTSAEQLLQAHEIFGALGHEIYVDEESYLDMATALSGSGPAYVFMMMEAMIDAGVHMGFSRRVARELVFQTMLGSVKYAQQSGKHVAELRNQVTSPGGTTAEALYHLDKGGFRTVVSRGIWAAFQRSRSLGQGQQIKGPNTVG
ncbi:MAG: pyrroline-5-carboxylate reductase [Anaerolineae bacterium]|nr:pyrroline-5-carboxylate reductase [Anaerolineae bacterium]